MVAVLITGATGQQGGSLIKSLVARKASLEILAVTRNTQSPSAQKLKQLSSQIKLVQGNLDDPAAIFENARQVADSSVWGVFSVQTVAMGDDAREEKQGKALVDESLKQKVQFFVYTSVDRGGSASFTNPTAVPHFITKHNIEHHLVERSKDTAMQWCILRPTAFFDNLTPGFLGKVFATSFMMSLKGKPLQMVATDDIGFFGAEAFLNPEEYQGKSLSLAGDELTYTQMVRIFEEKTGQSIPSTFRLICWPILNLSKEFGYMFKWFHDSGFKADIPALKKIHPGLKDFETWLELDSEFVAN
ncbi:uncharacterized protein N7459_008951 [Penicillium hispanicum]|uniref:uncharacterized protein n=1 Tax=Penicillium hispanicum TaxID=1080232 RepID=UPI0025423138|nr:uncharacterized protein N7459_008951 [Penicillium hispanicum]KAJ5569521.1 hypothetical protein N7459_008951 [Penicillium hispanicum]